MLLFKSTHSYDIIWKKRWLMTSFLTWNWLGIFHRSCTVACQFFLAKFFGKLPLFANFWQTKVFGQCFFLNFQFLAKLEAAGFLDVFLTLEVPKLNSNDNYRGWALVVRLFFGNFGQVPYLSDNFLLWKNQFFGVKLKSRSAYWQLQYSRSNAGGIVDYYSSFELSSSSICLFGSPTTSLEH